MDELLGSFPLCFQESLRSLTRGAQLLIHQNLAWEPLEVVPSVALEVFSHSR